MERGLAMQNIMQERQLAAGGNLQSGSNIGGGQMVTADFVMTPEVNFKENNAGGIGGAAAAFGGLFGGAGAVVGALAGGMKFKQAQTTLMLSDTRSGIQIATATGAAEKSDFGIGAVFGGGSVVYPKIAGVKVHKKADEGSAVVARLSKDSEALVSSTEVNGMVEVETADHKGWVSASKVRK